MKRDPEFAAAVAEAEESSTAALEVVAFERALNGVEEPVVSQGVVVTTVRRYDNNLLMQLLRARDPARYNPQQNIRADVKLGGGVFVVPPQAANLADEWERIWGAHIEQVQAHLTQQGRPPPPPPPPPPRGARGARQEPGRQRRREDRGLHPDL